jgi:transcriptional regulator with XRE-family HTH domain
VSETHIGTRIREARRARGVSQKQLAQQVDISVRTLRAYEQNKRFPDDKTLHATS